MVLTLITDIANFSPTTGSPLQDINRYGMMAALHLGSISTTHKKHEPLCVNLVKERFPSFIQAYESIRKDVGRIK